MGVLSERANFLFRSEDGTIDAQTWRRHAAWLAALVTVLTAIWFGFRPYAHHDLAKTAFFAPMTILAFAYLIVYAFALIFAAISYTMLSMKRFRDRGEPTALAGIVPLLGFCAGSLHFLQAKTPDVIAIWYVVGLDALTGLAIVGTIVDLGFRPSRL